MKISSSHLIAHRGHQAPFPENSLLAILDAIAAGAKNIEFDVQLTGDGEVALYHDEEMSRISGSPHLITELERHQLSQYSASEPTRLAERFANNPIEFLDELLPFIRKHQGIHFFLELKEESLNKFGDDFCFDRLLKTLNPIPNNIVLISFDMNAVKQAKIKGFMKTALVFRDWSQRNTLLAEARADYGFINYTRIPTDDSIQADKPIMVYEVSSPDIGEPLLARGAAAVETFHIRKFLKRS